MNREIRLRNRNARCEEIQAEKSVEHEVLDVDCDTDQSVPSLDIFYGSEVTITEQFKSVAVQCELLSGTENKVEQCDIATNTTLELSSIDFRIDNYRHPHKSSELHFYTGFEDYIHFMFVFNLFGPQVHHLLYYPLRKPINDDVKVLQPKDEFFLTVVKLRRNMCNKELGFRFGVEPSVVSRTFITWINFLYCQFQELNLWVPHSVISNVLHSRGKKSGATVIIDCTEVQIDRPKNPLSQQQSYSNYKRLNTVKVLIGLSETGTVTFVSEAYGGSTSDRQVFEKSGLLQKLEAKDVVLADRGFNIQDLLLRRNVRLDIPDFVPQKGQLEQKQLYRSKNLSSKRIHVERIIGLGKTYKILTGPITQAALFLYVLCWLTFAPTLCCNIVTF